MPISIDVRSKRKAFEGGPNLWNAVLYGPRELFDQKKNISMTLIRHGFSITKDDGDYMIWSTPNAPVAPPLYLGMLLQSKHGVQMTKATREMVLEACEEINPEDDLAKLIGKDKVAAGDAKLLVLPGSRSFIANCNKSNAKRIEYLMGAGWLPVSPERISDRVRAKYGDHPFLTADPFIASNLAAHMSTQARALLQEMTQASRLFIEQSSTQSAPEDLDIPIPEGLDYMPFQKAGIASVLRSNRSAIIADDMGLGKTIQGIGVINGRPDTANVLVICQANMKLKWVREMEKWLVRKDFSISYAEGNDLPQTDIVVINYDILDRHKEELRKRRWDIILVDEAHNLQNPEAKRTNAAFGDVINLNPEIPPLKLAKDGIILPMTGTPKPNKVSGLWPLLTMTRPDIWGRGPEAYKAFIDRYQPPKLLRKKMQRGSREYMVTIPLPGEPVRELELQLRMRGSGSFIRRMKKDTDLPPKFRTAFELPFRFTEEDRKALAQIDADIEQIALNVCIEDGRIKEGDALPASAIIDVITGLAPGSPHFTEGARVRANLGLLKAPYMARFISEELLADEDLAVEDRRKTVVFAHHKAVISKMAEVLRKDFPDGVIVYDGSITSPKKKQQLVDRFQTDPTARVFLMSKSGNSGITLTAAHRMRIAEPDWDPANMAQVEDRIWRIGQEQPCTIGYLFAPGSHDMNIGEGLLRKTDTNERTLNSFVLTSKKRPSKKDAQSILFGTEENNEEPVLDIEKPESPQMELPL